MITLQYPIHSVHYIQLDTINLFKQTLCNINLQF